MLCRFSIALLIGGLCSPRANAAETLAKPGEGKAKMEAARLEIGALRTNIFLTLSLLDQARNAETPQVREALYQQFDVQFTNMIQQVSLTGERARVMKQKGETYFADWEARTAEITDPEKRKQAESRYEVRKRSFDRLVEDLQQARSNFEPMLADLRQMQQLLRENPDVLKAAAARDVFMRANWRGMDVRRFLEETEVEFQFLASDFAQNEK